MTGREAVNILFDTYKNLVLMGGRGCGKTVLRTALLMGANAVDTLEKMSKDIDWDIYDKEKDMVHIPRDEYERLLEYELIYKDLNK